VKNRVEWKKKNQPTTQIIFIFFLNYQQIWNFFPLFSITHFVIVFIIYLCVQVLMCLQNAPHRADTHICTCILRYYRTVRINVACCLYNMCLYRILNPLHACHVCMSSFGQSIFISDNFLAKRNVAFPLIWL